MDNSQSSDVFSDSALSSCNGSSLIMDALDYDSLLQNTKASLCNNVLIKKVSFPNHFTSLLEDCRLCITQSLDFVENILSDANIAPSKLAQYMENAVSLLQMLSGLIKNVVESISMSCCAFKTFPTTTGHIIMLVFTHCKNSEAVYGIQLKNVQTQLKDLFRMCHELQLTYLMVLEKHFIFDLTEREHLNIIIEALEINLKIGEVVQSLDVKTMAEQWKAYTALCEKYSSHLMDKLIYQQCIQSLCCMIANNLKTALEVDQDEKVMVRSLKVTNFVIKIMLKICIIFRAASLRDYSQLVDLLIFVHFHSPSYLEFEESPPPIINGIAANVCTPTYLLMMELIGDEKFVNIVTSYDIKNISKDEKLLGYVLLIVNMMKSVVNKGEPISFPKNILIECVFRCLAFCHVWINVGLRFKNESKCKNTFGLFEYILTHTTALALTLNSEEMCYLERTMCEAVLGTECVTALFASTLWTALAVLSNNRQLMLTQMISLCQMYQKLENHELFKFSPQEQQLSHTLRSLFESMRQEDRAKLSRHFNPIDKKNMSLWIALKISNLPMDIQRNIQDEILRRFKQHLITNIYTKESIDDLVKLMKLSSTCSFTEVDDGVEESLIKAWMKACPKNLTFLSRTLDAGTVWYLEYVGALVKFTSAMEEMFHQNSANLIKVLHVISNIIQLGNTELNLVLIDLLCNLAIQHFGYNKHSVTALVTESLRTILIDDCSSNIVKNKLIRKINLCDKRLEQIVSSVLSEDPVLQDVWDNLLRLQKEDFDRAKLKQHLMITSENKYVHKCMETRLQIGEISENVDEIQKSCSSNFDFADLDTLFDNESDYEQPACKKVKIDGGEAQAILDRLERDASLLCSLKKKGFTGENKKRIEDLCDKLRSLVE